MPIAVQGYMSSGLYTHTCQSERERKMNAKRKMEKSVKICLEIRLAVMLNMIYSIIKIPKMNITLFHFNEYGAHQQ